MSATRRDRSAARLSVHVQDVTSFNTVELARKHRELYGEPARTHNRQLLIKRVQWRLQVAAEGIDLSARARDRIAELGDRMPEAWLKREAQLLAKAAAERPAESKVEPRDPRLPPIGTKLTRVYRQRAHEVEVGESGFCYGGQQYKTLSAVAKEITGTAWNGFTFFGINAKTKEAAP